jgi:hypothetical protein
MPAAERKQNQASIAEKIYFRLQLRGFLAINLQNVLTLKQAV